MAAAIDLSGIAAGEWVVEVGAGTGQFGREFLGKGVRYCGFDLSEAMLQGFRRHLPDANSDALLVRADGRSQWPLAPGRARLVFGSRAIHLLPVEHVLREVREIAREGTVLLIGRVERAADGLRSRMRREMRSRLGQYGMPLADGRRCERALIDQFCVRGARRLEPLVAARWRASGRPADVIADWGGKAGLGGVTPAESIKTALLADLRSWAQATLGGLDRPQHWDEAFVLTGVRFPSLKQ